jgi:hypothetical protein
MVNKMNNIKTFFSNLNKGIISAYNIISSNLVLVLSGIIGLLVFYIKMKNREIESFKSQIDLTKTNKQADLLEAQINQKLQQNNLLQKEVDGYNQVLNQLQEKRKSIPEGDKNPEDFWKNN